MKSKHCFICLKKLKSGSLSYSREKCLECQKKHPYYIYFIEAQKLGLIKIGITSTSIETRLSSMQSSSPDVLKLLGFIPGDYQLEHQIHRKLKGSHSHREWYYPTTNVLNLVEFYIHRVVYDL